MIQLSLGQFIVLLVGVALSFIALQWIVELTRRRRRSPMKSHAVILCRVCGVRYEAEIGGVCDCPVCLTPNEAATRDEI